MNKIQNKWFRWSPNRDLLAVVVSYILVVASLASATYLATAKNGGLYFIIYAIVCALLFGVVFPLIWTLFIRRRPVATLGITGKNLLLSLSIQIVLSIILFLSAYRGTQVPSFALLAPLVALALTIGFFEAVFWRGWIQLRLEESFGIIPGIIFGSVLYSLYHIGYGMPWSEMLFLFFIGVMFAVIFRFTKSVFILWPIFQPMGQLVTLLKDGLPLPMIAVLGFGEVLLAMLVLTFLLSKFAKKKGFVTSPEVS